MNPPTELELQLFLAKQLPEEIAPTYVEDEEFPVCYRWIAEPDLRVTPREWDYIVRRVEEKLSDEQYEEYTGELILACGVLRYVSAPWPTRTIALMKVLA